jgi:PBP1b-binding outer membrane lipoprotein LpoB
MTSKAILAILIGLCLLLAGCTDLLGEAKTAWNIINSGAYEALAEVERLHQEEVNSVADDPSLTQMQKLEALNLVAVKWKPVYERYRILRSALASAKAALTAAEAAEASGATPDWIKLQQAVRETVAAQKALAEAMP